MSQTPIIYIYIPECNQDLMKNIVPKPEKNSYLKILLFYYPDTYNKRPVHPTKIFHLWNNSEHIILH